ncbi:hypothetical protein NDU88_005412 [Pleurodeles waltl]|uniref:Uncharacterized protein n=1 Tax=Pleurodeles waltl TaxID=8319 RepID=A0AAV7PFN5_PLEWA|nr:hypothetical protein NDU88_005412 [Pleurodeles waltl]
MLGIMKLKKNEGPAPLMKIDLHSHLGDFYNKLANMITTLALKSDLASGLADISKEIHAPGEREAPMKNDIITMNQDIEKLQENGKQYWEDPIDLGVVQTFIDEARLPCLNRSNIDNLEELRTEDEVLAAIAALYSDKEPGPDGLTNWGKTLKAKSRFLDLGFLVAKLLTTHKWRSSEPLVYEAWVRSLSVWATAECTTLQREDVLGLRKYPLVT